MNFSEIDKICAGEYLEMVPAQLSSLNIVPYFPFLKIIFMYLKARGIAREQGNEGDGMPCCFTAQMFVTDRDGLLPFQVPGIHPGLPLCVSGSKHLDHKPLPQRHDGRKLGLMQIYGSHS